MLAIASSWYSFTPSQWSNIPPPLTDQTAAIWMLHRNVLSQSAVPRTFGGSRQAVW